MRSDAEFRDTGSFFEDLPTPKHQVRKRIPAEVEVDWLVYKQSYPRRIRGIKIGIGLFLLGVGIPAIYFQPGFAMYFIVLLSLLLVLLPIWLTAHSKSQVYYGDLRPAVVLPDGERIAVFVDMSTNLKDHGAPTLVIRKAPLQHACGPPVKTNTRLAVSCAYGNGIIDGLLKTPTYAFKVVDVIVIRCITADEDAELKCFERISSEDWDELYDAIDQVGERLTTGQHKFYE